MIYFVDIDVSYFSLGNARTETGNKCIADILKV